MNLKDLKEHVDRLSLVADMNRCDPKDITVGIVVRRVGSVGGTPIVDVANMHLGFDWDSGKLLITATTDLREIDRDEIKSLMDRYEELGWKQYKISGLQRENKKLKEEIATLKAPK